MILAIAVLVLAALMPHDLAALRSAVAPVQPAPVVAPVSPPIHVEPAPSAPQPIPVPDKPAVDLNEIHACIDVRPPAMPFAVEELAADTAKFWPNGSRLKVAFANGDAANQARWFACAADWSAVANIDFVPATTASYDILVSFSELGGYYSYLGTDARGIPRGTPTMVLSGLDRQGDAEFQRVARHEIGHALGCIHEHQSPAAAIPWNYPVLYAWYAQTQGWSKAEVDQQVVIRYAAPTTQYTAWDRFSIMEYPIDVNLVTDPSFAIGWNAALTATDREFIAECYPGRGITAPEPPPAKPDPPVISPPEPKPVEPPKPPPLPVKPQPKPKPKPPTKPVPPPVMVLTPNGGDLAGSLAAGQVARYTMRIDHAATYRVGTHGPSGTEVVLARANPPEVLSRGRGPRVTSNGQTQRWLTPGNYVVDVVMKRPSGPVGTYTVEACQLGGSR